MILPENLKYKLIAFLKFWFVDNYLILNLINNNFSITDISKTRYVKTVIWNQGVIEN